MKLNDRVGDLKKQLAKLKEFNDAENYIYNYFDGMKNGIDF